MILFVVGMFYGLSYHRSQFSFDEKNVLKPPTFVSTGINAALVSINDGSNMYKLLTVKKVDAMVTEALQKWLG